MIHESADEGKQGKDPEFFFAQIEMSFENRQIRFGAICAINRLMPRLVIDH